MKSGLIALLLGLVLAGAVGTLQGCASDPVPVAETTNVDRSDPDEVIATALETMFTWNPTKEDSSNVAYKRAAIYLSGDLGAEGGDSPPPGPDSQWAQWRAEGVSVAARAYFVADETPPDSDTEAHRVVVVVQSATTEDGRLVDEIRHTVWVTAGRSDTGWRVTSIKF